MLLRLEILKEKKLIGHRVRMSFVGNKTVDLWRNFMPRRKEITNKIGTALYSVEVYGPQFFHCFDATADFEKWAAIEVTGFDTLPPGMETLVLPTGLYAVFLHTGPASGGVKTYDYIFSAWIPASSYQVDDRPHFAVMGERYRGEDPRSEEEIWIPVRPK